LVEWLAAIPQTRFDVYSCGSRGAGLLWGDQTRFASALKLVFVVNLDPPIGKGQHVELEVGKSPFAIGQFRRHANVDADEELTPMCDPPLPLGNQVDDGTASFGRSLPDFALGDF
jgi:hypothetical protein